MARKTEIDGQREVEVEVSIRLPQLDAFNRANPPGASSGAEVWHFATQMIDYGCALFATNNTVRSESPTRDLVVAALLRRALITTEGLLNILYHGLPEAAIPLLRTLLDIEVNAKLVTKDSSEATAKRLAAYHYFAVTRHQHKLLTDPLSRRLLEEFEGGKTEAAGLARKNEDWFEAPGFVDVRDSIVPGRPWHGYARAEDAFAAAGLTTDYFQTYDSGTLFTHAANIDFDFADIVDGQVMLKAPLTADDLQLVTILGVALTHLYAIIKVFVEDKKIQEVEGSFTVDGVREEIVSAMDAISFLLAQALPEAQSKAKHMKSGAPEA